MCIPIFKKKSSRSGAAAGPRHPTEYMVPRTSIDDRPTRRTRASLEGHAAAAPGRPNPGGRRYPKNFRDQEGLFPETGGIPLREYPARPGHHYNHNQNARGHERSTSPGGTVRTRDPGHARIIMDDANGLVGMTYHPRNEPARAARAYEYYH